MRFTVKHIKIKQRDIKYVRNYRKMNTIGNGYCKANTLLGETGGRSFIKKKQCQYSEGKTCHGY